MSEKEKVAVETQSAKENVNETKSAKQKRIGKLVSKDLLQCVIVLSLIALISGAVLGLLNWVTYTDPDKKIMEEVGVHYNISAESVEKDSNRVVNVEGSKSKVDSCFVAKKDKEVLGYVYQSTGSGAKGGTLQLLVYISKDGKIQDIQKFSEKETAGYFDKVFKANQPKYLGVDVKEIKSFELNGDNATDVDAVSQATFTSRGFNNAVNAVVYAFNNYKEVA